MRRLPHACHTALRNLAGWPLPPRYRYPETLALAAALALGCNAQDATQSTAPDAGLTAPDAAAAPATAAASATATPPTTTAAGLPEFDPHDFVHGVNNPLFPLPLAPPHLPRQRGRGRETVITDVTRDHKTILGVQVITVLDRVFLNGG